MIQLASITGTAASPSRPEVSTRPAAPAQKPPSGETAVFWLATCAALQQRVGAARRWSVCPDCGNWRLEFPRDGRCRYCREPIL